MTIELTPELLRAYFEAHRAEPVGGIACCPIQSVLVANGAEDATVGYQRWYHTRRPTDEHHTLPPFVKYFIELTDRGYRVDEDVDQAATGYVTWGSMTGADALLVLEEALNGNE